MTFILFCRPTLPRKTDDACCIHVDSDDADELTAAIMRVKMRDGQPFAAYEVKTWKRVWFNREHEEQWRWLGS